MTFLDTKGPSQGNHCWGYTLPHSYPEPHELLVSLSISKLLSGSGTCTGASLPNEGPAFPRGHSGNLAASSTCACARGHGDGQVGGRPGPPLGASGARLRRCELKHSLFCAAQLCPPAHLHCLLSGGTCTQGGKRLCKNVRDQV